MDKTEYDFRQQVLARMPDEAFVLYCQAFVRTLTDAERQTVAEALHKAYADWQKPN